jgi:polysaccharide export outer membrane protein
MANYSSARIDEQNRLTGRRSAVYDVTLAWAAVAALLLSLIATGCQTPPPPFGDVPHQKASQSDQKVSQSDVIVLHEGDTVRIMFPGAPNLNSVQQIRRDGRISLPLLGEFKAAGLTPPAMESELIKQYGPQLQTKEVTVTLDSSAFAVYVSGAVLRPGRIISDRPITALEAIMEAGGFNYTKANMKAVAVIRRENGRTERHTLNLKRVLDGQPGDPFNLKPADIIYVPERFTWF